MSVAGGCLITKDRIKTLAFETGFHACGVTTLEPIPEAEETFRRWVREGKHGEMKYLKDFDERRARFRDRFQNVRSVIVLGVNYYSNNREVDRESCIVNRNKEAKKFAAMPQPICLAFDDPRFTFHARKSPASRATLGGAITTK